jgi:hypothetical protein
LQPVQDQQLQNMLLRMPDNSASNTCKVLVLVLDPKPLNPAKPAEHPLKPYLQNACHPGLVEGHPVATCKLLMAPGLI